VTSYARSIVTIRLSGTVMEIYLTFSDDQMGALKMRDWKMQDWNYRHHITGGGKCGTGIIGNKKRMERHVWHNLVFSYKHMVHI